MKFNLDKAVNRLSWRFSNETTFKPDNNDVEALNTVFEWINHQKKETLNKNTLFAKLFIYHLTMNVRHYETTILNDFPQKDIISLLEKPLDLYFKAFHQDIHNNQLNKLVEFDKINAQIDKDIAAAERDYPKFDSITSQENYIKNKEAQRITEDQKIKVVKDYKNLKETFTLEFVKGKLIDMVTEAINKY
jgi:hypothetical protein